MNCRQFEQQLGRPLTDEARMHVAYCEACTALGQWFDGSATVPATPVVSLPSDLGPVRPLPSPWLLAGGIFLAAVAVLAIGGMQMGLDGWQALQSGQRIAIFTGMAAVGAAAALLLARQMFPTLANRVSPLACVAAAFTALIAVPVLLMPMDFDAAGLAGISAGCGMRGILYASVAWAAIWLVMRRGYFVHPALAGALSGLASGLAALTVLEFCCPLIETSHVLIWHSGVVAVAVASASALAYFGSGRRA